MKEKLQVIGKKGGTDNAFTISYFKYPCVLPTWPCLQTGRLWGCLDHVILLLENFQLMLCFQLMVQKLMVYKLKVDKAIFSWEALFLCLKIYSIYMNKYEMIKWKRNWFFPILSTCWKLTTTVTFQVSYSICFIDYDIANELRSLH